MSSPDTRSIYAAMAELASRHDRIGATQPTDQDPEALTRYELRVFSQNGEDGIIAEILRRIGVPQSHFAEFGIQEGREGCCVALADMLGWPGAFIEPDPALHSGLASKYSGASGVRTLAAEVRPDNVEALLAHLGVPEEPALLCIDADGADYWIWRALERSRPRLVVIEYNSALGPVSQLVAPADTTGPWDGTDFFGASIGALRRLAAEKGYELVHTDLTGTKAFFVRSDLASGHFVVGDRVPIRGPNYGFTHCHPRDPYARSYVDPTLKHPA
jgi:hypothetical protein